MMLQSISSQIRFIGFLLFLAMFPALFGPVVVGAVEKSPAAEQIQPMSRDELSRQITGKQDLFVYQRENRPDPFLPFIKEKVLQQDKQAVEEVPQEKLLGMQRFEPGQLSLVAIILKQPSPIAMVQDSSGMGYIIEEGMKIGRTGVIEQITANTVIIKQTTTTWNQEKLFKRVEMVLRKEGEKPL